MIQDNSRLRVGVIGLGKMGSALADALIAAGHDVIVWNRTPDRARRFAEVGIAVAGSPAELAAAVDVLVVCLFDHAANEAAVLTDEVAAGLHGKTLLQLSHVDTDSLPAYEAWARHHDIALLKGLIFVYPDDIRGGNGTVVYGGPRQVYEAVQPLAQAMGGRPVWAGERLDAPNAYGAAYCCVLFPILVGFLNGAALCHRAGIAVGDFHAGIVAPFIQGPVLAGMIEGLATASASRRYTDDVQASLDAWNHDLHLAIDTIRRNGAEASLMRAVAAQFDRARAAGHGAEDLASIFETLITLEPTHDRAD